VGDHLLDRLSVSSAEIARIHAETTAKLEIGHD
jgi:hypothetical protein